MDSRERRRLEASRVAMRYVEHRLELGRMGEELPDEIRKRSKGTTPKMRFDREAKGLV